jgi:hypothetical protein
VSDAGSEDGLADDGEEEHVDTGSHALSLVTPPDSPTVARGRGAAGGGKTDAPAANPSGGSGSSDAGAVVVAMVGGQVLGAGIATPPCACVAVPTITRLKRMGANGRAWGFLLVQLYRYCNSLRFCDHGCLACRSQ